jgi:hypothetical protein
MDEIDEKNNELEKPRDIDFDQEKEESIDQEMNDAKENLEEGKQKKSEDNQQKAADMMKEMADDAAAMQSAGQQQQQAEDMDALRNILESLMTLSFDQEELMNKMGRVSTSDPAYRKYGRRQRRIIDDTKIVKDSLLALAKRQPKIASFIDKELNAIATNHQASIEDIDDHRKRI